MVIIIFISIHQKSPDLYRIASNTFIRPFMVSLSKVSILQYVKFVDTVVIDTRKFLIVCIFRCFFGQKLEYS